MNLMASVLAFSEIILAISLTVLVLLQAKGSDLGSFMGSSGDSGGFRTRRGIEQTMYRLTIVTAILFFINTILAFLAWG